MTALIDSLRWITVFALLFAINFKLSAINDTLKEILKNEKI